MTSESFWSAIPTEAFERMVIPQLVKSCIRCMRVAIRKNFFADALSNLVDELDASELERFKEQVTRADGYVGLIMRKRLHMDLIVKDTGPVIADRFQAAMITATNAGRHHLTFKEIEEALNGRRT